MREAPSSVARVVYASESNVGHAVYAEMERIRMAALRHNVPVGVFTGLLYQSGWFVQWKEGPQEAIDKLMERVARDPRHSNLRIVHSSHGPRLLSGPWSMAVVRCDESHETMGERVESVRRRMQEGLQYSPVAVWRQLSTPMAHAGGTRQTDPDAFQRLTVCDAVGQSSFDLVHWLGSVHREPVVQRRFAGESGLDVGTDYVDFAADDRVARVIAMARNGLLLPLTRAFLADDSHIVLLLSGSRERDITLVRRVADACEGMHSPPALVAIAPHSTAHAAPFGMARECGLVYLDALANLIDPASVWRAGYPYFARWRDAANSSGLSRTDDVTTLR